MSGNELMDLAVLERKKYNYLNEVLDLTEQIGQAADRNDQVAMRMLVAMRQDPILSLAEVDDTAKTRLEGLKMAYIGDGNNMANSLIVGGLKCGMSVAAACPEGYDPDPKVLEFARSDPAFEFQLCRTPQEAAKNADVLLTDVWASMGQEEEKAVRVKAFTGFQINQELLDLANPGCMVQHCLPAHRGEEITADVFEGHATEIFDEAENRLHAQKAVMYLLMRGNKEEN